MLFEITALDASIDKIPAQDLPTADDAQLQPSFVNDRVKDVGNSTDTVASPLLKPSSILHKSEGNIHALSILARIMNDSQFDPASTKNGNETEIYDYTIQKHGIGIAEHVRAWTINVSKLDEGDAGEMNRKIEEVAWAVCIIYGIGGWTGRQGGSGGQFNADFIL